MGLSEILALITPQTAMGVAIVAVLGCYAFAKRLIVPGPSHRELQKRLDRSERRERAWQRLYILAVTAGKAAGLPELDFELEMEECES